MSPGDSRLETLPLSLRGQTLGQVWLIRQAIEGEQLASIGGGQVTVSIGLACCPAGQTPLQTLRGKADEALYAAKRAGRNQVCLEPVTA